MTNFPRNLTLFGVVFPTKVDFFAEKAFIWVENLFKRVLDPWTFETCAHFVFQSLSWKMAVGCNWNRLWLESSRHFEIVTFFIHDWGFWTLKCLQNNKESVERVSNHQIPDEWPIWNQGSFFRGKFEKQDMHKFSKTALLRVYDIGVPAQNIHYNFTKNENNILQSLKFISEKENRGVDALKKEIFEKWAR